MENLNYNGIEDRHNEDEVSYTYYLNYDKENYGDYIKFELKKRKIKSVSIYTNEQ